MVLQRSVSSARALYAASSFQLQEFRLLSQSSSRIMANSVALCFNYAENDNAAELDALLAPLDADKKKQLFTAVNAEGMV